MYYRRNQRHFRNRTTIVQGVVKQHPSYIVGEEGNNYLSFGITHKNKKGKRHYNHQLRRNPNPYDSTPSYIRKQVESSSKRLFSRRRIDSYRMSPEDDSYIDSLLQRRRRN